MKIIHAFLFSLGMVIAPEFEIPDFVLQEIVAYSLNLARVNRGLYKYVKESDEFLKRHASIRVQNQEEVADAFCTEYKVTTPFGCASMSAYDNDNLSPYILNGRIYRLNDLSDVDMPVTLTADASQTNISIDLQISPYTENCISHKFRLEFREPGTYKLKDFILAMATLTKNIHQILGRHNSVLDMNTLDKSKPEWLARMYYDCATIAYRMMEDVPNVGLCLRSNIGFKIILSRINNTQYDPRSPYSQLNTLCIDDTRDSYTVADAHKDQQNHVFVGQAFAICKETLRRILGSTSYPYIQESYLFITIPESH